jgi:hypothetical protein
MSNEQPPNEPTLAEFREFLLNSAQEQPDTGFWRGAALDAYMRVVVGAVDAYLERAGTAAGNDPADDGRGDPLSRSNLVSVARAHRNASQPQRAAEGDLDRLLDDLAAEFNLADVRIIRGVAAALTDAMPRIALAHRERGMSPDEIAAATGLTTSRINQLIREEKQRRAADRDTQQ